MAKAQQKIIISCAITGAVHTPTMSDYLPVTPDEIAAAKNAGAEGRRPPGISVCRPYAPRLRLVHTSGTTNRMKSLRNFPSPRKQGGWLVGSWTWVRRIGFCLPLP
jgi:hypothetical protein